MHNLYKDTDEDAGICLVQQALEWLLSKPVAGSVIVGAKHSVQLGNNVVAGDVLLSDEQLAAMRRLMA